MKPANKKQSFKAVIEAAGGGGAFVNIPFDVEEMYGSKRVKITASIEGEPYKGTLVRMGSDCHKLLILKEIREKIGKNIGDEVAVILAEDLAPRIVEVPSDLQAAFTQNPEAEVFFKQLSYTNQKEYVKWIEEAKRAETRLSRISKALEWLGQNKPLR